LDLTDAWPHHGWVVLEAKRGDIGAALVHLQDAIARDPQLRERARTAPAFAPLREDPRFQAVVGKDEG